MVIQIGTNSVRNCFSLIYDVYAIEKEKIRVEQQKGTMQEETYQGVSRGDYAGGVLIKSILSRFKNFFHSK